MAKEVKKRPKKPAATSGRVRKLTKKQQKAKDKKETRQHSPVAGSFRLSWRVLKMWRKYWKTLGGIVIIYLLLNIIFASGVSDISNNFDSIKTNLNASGGTGLWRAAGGFASLVGSSGVSGSTTGSALQSVLFVLESLVIIYALRHLMSGQAVYVKLAWYRAMTPLIPFLLVIFMILIQLLPITLGATLLAVIASAAFTSATWATAVSIVFFVLMAAWSIYMVSSSIFALYIVTLPDMQPRQALRSAKDLVRFRRWEVIRKVLFLPIIIMIVMGLVIVPLILYAQRVVPGVFYVLSMLSILFVHSYLYSVYRELLQ
ncbi:MAG TPA: hypothetical protein VFW90_01600 [Candidatus Saccharimonadales bacterium]|nr:hypothetical protein [Candidatus Saccharimonadales bacterium]